MLEGALALGLYARDASVLEGRAGAVVLPVSNRRATVAARVSQIAAALAGRRYEIDKIIVHDLKDEVARTLPDLFSKPVVVRLWYQ